MSAERLQKILARAGVASRRKAEELIRQGRVTVDGTVASLGDKADPDTEAIKVDGKRVCPGDAHHYLLLNKPAAYLSTRADPEGRSTVFDLIPARLHKALVTVGRLDYASEGLLILTDDGDLANRVAHPRYGCTKTYEVKVKGTPGEASLARLRAGLVIEGRRTALASIRSLRVRGARGGRVNSWWTVELTEGRSRQIREMFFRIDHPVQRLRRVAIGAISDPRLVPGSYRELSSKEIQSLAGGAAHSSGRRAQRPNRRAKGGRR